MTRPTSVDNSFKSLTFVLDSNFKLSEEIVDCLYLFDHRKFSDHLQLSTELLPLKCNLSLKQ